MAMATATLKRTVTWTSSPLDACTMKVTANPLPAPSGWHAPANFIPLQRDPEKACPALGAGWVTGFRLVRERETFARRSCSNKSSGEQSLFVESQRENNRQTRERAPISMESPFRKSSSAFFPASRAARWERKPPSHIRIPMGFRLRRISQHQESLPLPLRKIAT